MSSLNIANGVKELRLLFEISRLFGGLRDMGRSLDEALGLMTRHTGMAHGAVVLTDPEGKQISLTAAVGFPPEAPQPGHSRPGQGLAERVMATGQTLVGSNRSVESGFLNLTSARDLDKAEISLFCVPVKMGTTTIGALTADRLFADSVPLNEDLRLLTILADLVAQAFAVRLDLAAERESLAAENKRLRVMLESGLKTPPMVGSSPGMTRVFNFIIQAALTNLAVLIRGESGVGKKLAAETIHLAGRRAGRPFITVDCAALDEPLAENEIFGPNGCFKLADGGTLFLAGIDALPAPVLAKLLRAIEEKRFERGGDEEPLTADVRLIAASRLDLTKMAAVEGHLRKNNQAIDAFSITIPPLRERLEDLPALVEHFINYWSGAVGKRMTGIAPDAMNALRVRPWPGNIRELSQALARAVILSEDGLVHGHHLSFSGPGRPDGRSGSLPEALDELERRLITMALAEAGGNMSRAAQALGVSERIMGLRMKKFGLDFKNFRAGKKKTGRLPSRRLQ